MKKTAAVSFLLFLAIIFIFTFLRYKYIFQADTEIKKLNKNEEIRENRASEYEINNYKVMVKKVTDEKVKIVPNFDEKKTSEYVYESHDCTTLINGGLYEKSGKPLGLYYLNAITSFALGSSLR